MPRRLADAWLGKRVRFTLASGAVELGTVQVTGTVTLTILTDGCGHPGCRDHPPRWFTRLPEDVDAE